MSSNRQSAIGNRQCGYTLIEMLATVAVLIIVLGLMISLARHVRTRAAEGLSAEILGRLKAFQSKYNSSFTNILPKFGQVPEITEVKDEESKSTKLIVTYRPAETPEEFRLSARLNNASFVRALRQVTGFSPIFGEMPVTIYNNAAIFDAWGSPIVFMSTGDRDFGTAPNDDPFFFSAGPDRDYGTREDNLYSYEGPPGGGGNSNDE